MRGGHSMATQAKQGLSRQRAQGASWPSSAWRAGGQSSSVRCTPSVAGHFRAVQAGHRGATLQSTQGASRPCRAQRSELSNAMRLSTLSTARRCIALNAGQSAATPSRAGAHSGARQGNRGNSTLSASILGAPGALHGAAGLPVQSKPRLTVGALSKAELRTHRGPRPGNAHGPKQPYARQRAA